MEYNTILFDFDGVLSRERFYDNGFSSEFPEVYNWIQENIFTDKDLLKNWMRGETSSKEINRGIARKTGMDFNVLHPLFEKSVYDIKLDRKLVDKAKELKEKDKKTAIVTDNMDVFSEITIKNHKLDEIFDAIVNSSDKKMLKKDKNGKLFDIALDLLNSKIQESVLIDDSEGNVELFISKGGDGIVYKDYEDLKII